VALSLTGSISPEEQDRLAALVERDVESRRLYLDVIYETNILLAWALRGQPDSDVILQSAKDVKDEERRGIILPVASSAEPAFFHPAFTFFSHDLPFAYLLATVIVGVGMLIGAFTYVSQPGQFLATDRRLPNGGWPKSRADVSQRKCIGRITAMNNCLWKVDTPADGKHNFAENHSPDSEFQIANASSRRLLYLGDRIILRSGLLEITYDTGARVILQDLATYDLEAKNGGVLSIGKLTGTVEVNRAKGFAVRTPTAIVTDLGTEFGVEVKPDRTTDVVVFRGVVETRRLTSQGISTEKRRLVAGQSVRCEPHSQTFSTPTIRPEAFPRSVQSVWESGKFNGTQLGKQWSFDTANAGNHWSLTARPGFLRMKLYHAYQDAWNERGTAPILHTGYPTPANRFSVETNVDLGSGNGGIALNDSAGGLVVYDAARDNIVLALTLARHEPTSPPLRDIAVELRGQVLVRLPVELDAACLKLERNGSVWKAFYRTQQGNDWQFVKTISESEFVDGLPTKPRIGVMGKSFNKTNPGGPGAAIDFEYININVLSK
jgi:hypothetical protein